MRWLENPFIRNKGKRLKRNKTNHIPRREFDNPATQISLPFGAIQTGVKSTLPLHQFELVCNSGHDNWVSNIPIPVVRIGSSRSKLRFIQCIRCGERLVGGTLYPFIGEDDDAV